MSVCCVYPSFGQAVRAERRHQGLDISPRYVNIRHLLPDTGVRRNRMFCITVLLGVAIGYLVRGSGATD